MDNELAYKGKYADPVITAYPAGAVDAYINNDTDTQLDFVDPVDPALNTKAVNKLCVKWDDSASNEDKLARIITQKYFALFLPRHGPNTEGQAILYSSLQLSTKAMVPYQVKKACAVRFTAATLSIPTHKATRKE